jgi:hypothetical protein
MSAWGHGSSSVSSEQEDILLEVMDFLVGWCGPHAKIE